MGGAGPLAAPIVSTAGALAAATDQPRFNGAWSQEKEDSVEVIYLGLYTLWFQLQNTVLLFGTFLFLDPVHFLKYEAWLLIGSILNLGALLGASLIEATQHLLDIPL